MTTHTHRRSARFVLWAVVALAVAAGRARATSLVASTGEASPVGWTFGGLSEGVVDTQGRVVFIGTSSAIFAGNGAGVDVRLGPDTVVDGAHVIATGTPALDANGCIVARVLLDAGGQAIVRECGVTVTTLVRTGDAVDGSAVPRVLDPDVFPAGADMVAFSGLLADGTSAVLRYASSGTDVLARAGDASPSGGTFATLHVLGMTDAGRVAYRASVSRGPDGLFASTPQVTTPILLVGAATPIGGSFKSLDGASVNPSDQWVVRSTMSTGNDALFRVDASLPLPVVDALAVEGDATPISGATFRGFPSGTVPTINPSGTVAFRALLSGVDSGAAIMTATASGDVTSIVTTRQQTPVGVLSQLRDPAIADDGSVVVPATVAGGGPALFVARGGTLTQLAAFGTATAADTVDTRFRFSDPAARATAESAVFLGQRDGVFRRSGRGIVEALAYSGQRSPVGGFFVRFDLPIVDGTGRVIFGGTVHQGSVKEAIFQYGDSGLGVLARPGQRAPGGGSFSSFFPSTVDDDARGAGGKKGVVVTATLQGTHADQGLFFFRGTRPAVIARSGQHVAGGRLAAFGSPAVDDRGRVAFVADVGRAERKRSVIYGTPGSLRAMARTGGETHTRLGGTFTTFGTPVVGPQGAVFRATLADAVSEAIFATSGHRIAAIAAATDHTADGGQIGSFGDPVVSGSAAYVLVRLASTQSFGGVYRAPLDPVPDPNATPPMIAAVLHAGDPGPAETGGTIARVDQLGPAPNDATTALVDIADGTAAAALLVIGPGS